jgi:hypothetical protein
MTERLRRALEHIDELPEAFQDELAEHIEEFIDPMLPVPPLPGSIAGTRDEKDIDFDQMIEELDRIRH